MSLTVFLDQDSLGPTDIDLAALQSAQSQWRAYATTLPGQTAERIATASIVISNKTMLDEVAFAAASALRLVCISATGTNNVDLNAARRHNVAVCNVTGYATPSVVQHVFAGLLALATRLPEYQRAVREGRWQTSAQFCLLDYRIRELAGMTLGIVGYGTLGQAVARVAEAFGMHVLIAQRPGSAAETGRVPLLELLPQVDVLSLHCPLTAETRGLIGAAELALMKPDALLINTARGGIVDETALAHALRAHRLGGAAVDVLTQEPPSEGNPLLAADIPNLILTPHIAWASREARQRMVSEVAENIRAFLRGEARNRIV